MLDKQSPGDSPGLCLSNMTIRTRRLRLAPKSRSRNRNSV